MNLILNFTCHFSCKPHLEMCAHATDPEAENSTIINSTIFSKNAFSLSFGIMVPSYFPMNKSFPNLQVWKIQCKVLCSLVHFRGWHVGMTEIRDVPWRFHQRFEILSFSVTEALVNCSHYWYWILWWGSQTLTKKKKNLLWLILWYSVLLDVNYNLWVQKYSLQHILTIHVSGSLTATLTGKFLKEIDSVFESSCSLRIVGTRDVHRHFGRQGLKWKKKALLIIM